MLPLNLLGHRIGDLDVVPLGINVHDELLLAALGATKQLEDVVRGLEADFAQRID